jgi:hypothetical protein
LVGPRPARLASVGTDIREVIASVVLTDADIEGKRRRSYLCSPVLEEAYGLRNSYHRGSPSSIDFAGLRHAAVDRNERVEDED